MDNLNIILINLMKAKKIYMNLMQIISGNAVRQHSIQHGKKAGSLYRLKKTAES